MMIEASAPGKLYLYGEHAVMFGSPSIVTALDKRMMVSVKERPGDSIIVNAPDIGVSGAEVKLPDINKEPQKELRFVLAATKNFFAKHNISTGLEIETKADFPEGKSLGSSAAVTVATLKALDALFKTNMDSKTLFDLGYKTHTIDIQRGAGSGFDIAAAVYGGTLYFTMGGQTIEPLKIENLPLLYASLPLRFDSPRTVLSVQEDARRFPNIYKTAIAMVKSVINEARTALETHDFLTAGRLMNLNQGFLESIGVCTQEASHMIYEVRRAGAHGAKMSGGGGDNIIALVPAEKKEIVKNVIKNHNGSVLDVIPNAPGCRIDKK